MGRSFGLVDYKVQQTDFFLERIRTADFDFFGVQCFADSFTSSSRSITFALQAVGAHLPGFKEWYRPHQDSLKTDMLAQFFHRYRTSSIHIGETVVRSGTSYRDSNDERQVQYFFMEVPDILNPPHEDVYTCCRRYFISLLNIVLDAYRTFPYQIDDRWYFTEENFTKRGKSLDDALSELGFPSGWLNCDPPFTRHDAWRTLRRTQTSGCLINEIFLEYLQKSFLGPDDPVRT